MNSHSMTLEEFQGYLARRLDVEPATLPVDADVRNELGLDSIQMFILLISLEDLGVEIPEALMPHLVTVRDVYAQYQNALAHRT